MRYKLLSCEMYNDKDVSVSYGHLGYTRSKV